MIKQRSRQQGVISIEFALLGLVFFLFILVVIDMGRWMMTWALLQESSNRVARVGALYDPVHTQPDIIKRAGLYKPKAGNSNESAVIPGLKTEHFILDWLDSDGESVGQVTCNNYHNIHFVESKINDYQFTFFSPVKLFNLDAVLGFPEFRVITPGESLGGDVCE